MTSINLAYENGRTVNSLQGLIQQEIDVAKRKLMLQLEHTWNEIKAAMVQSKVQEQLDQEEAKLRDQLQEVDNMPMGFIANRDIQRNKMNGMPKEELQAIIHSHPNVSMLIDMFTKVPSEGADLEAADGVSIDQCIQLSNQLSTRTDVTSHKSYDLINNTELIDKFQRIAGQMWLFIDNSGSLQQTIASYPETTRMLFLASRLNLTLQHFFPQTATLLSPKFMKNLVVLHVAGCKHYSMAKIMVPLSQHCPNLETIDVSETIIKHISQSKESDTLVITFPRLKTLVANSCDDLRSIHIQSGVPFTISAHRSKRLCHINCTPTLTSLSLQRMENIPESLLRLICAPNLANSITVYGNGWTVSDNLELTLPKYGGPPIPVISGKVTNEYFVANVSSSRWLLYPDNSPAILKLKVGSNQPVIFSYSLSPFVGSLQPLPKFGSIFTSRGQRLSSQDDEGQQTKIYLKVPLQTLVDEIPCNCTNPITGDFSIMYCTLGRQLVSPPKETSPLQLYINNAPSNDVYLPSILSTNMTTSLIFLYGYAYSATDSVYVKNIAWEAYISITKINVVSSTTLSFAIPNQIDQNIQVFVYVRSSEGWTSNLATVMPGSEFTPSNIYLSPCHLEGGLVTIGGVNFRDSTKVENVMIGDSPCTDVRMLPKPSVLFVCQAPAGMGTLPVSLDINSVAKNDLTFSYYAPVINTVEINNEGDLVVLSSEVPLVKDDRVKITLCSHQVDDFRIVENLLYIHFYPVIDTVSKISTAGGLVTVSEKSGSTVTLTCIFQSFPDSLEPGNYSFTVTSMGISKNNPTNTGQVSLPPVADKSSGNKTRRSLSISLPIVGGIILLVTCLLIYKLRQIQSRSNGIQDTEESGEELKPIPTPKIPDDRMKDTFALRDEREEARIQNEGARKVTRQASRAEVVLKKKNCEEKGLKNGYKGMEMVEMDYRDFVCPAVQLETEMYYDCLTVMKEKPNNVTLVTFKCDVLVWKIVLPTIWLLLGFTLGEESTLIGKGGFGDVFQMMVNGKLRAIKRPSKITDEVIQSILQEIAILIAVSDVSSLCQLVGVAFYKKQIIVRSFKDLVLGEDSKDLKKLNNIKTIAIDLCRAMKVLHELKVVHRDIAPGNILFNEHGQAILCDFGISRTVEENKECTTFCGNWR
eukprot:gene7356-8569_t